jgi:hypothetical protein
LKTALNVLHKSLKFSSKKYRINLDECGKEVIEIIFKIYKGNNVSFYLSRPFFIKEFIANYNRFIINGVIPASEEELMSIMQTTRS